MAAFDFFDVEGRGKLTVADLKARLGAFYKNLPSKEYKALISEVGGAIRPQLRGNSQPPPPPLASPTAEGDALRLLANNELGNYDPVKEAFEVYDPQGTGFVDRDLRSIFENLGYGEITDEDLAVLVETADADGDGRISLDDFRGMLSMSKERLQGDAAAAPP